MVSLADSSQMNAVKVLLFLALFLCWTSHSLFGSNAMPPECVCSQCGDCGAQGPKGEKGERGPKGVVGMQGLQGDAGAPGIKGCQGPSGVKGQQGEQGDAGVLGIKGCQGPPGVKGRQGKQGDAGQPGRRGAPGPPGEPLSPDDVFKVAQQIEHLKNFSTELSKIRASQMAIQECGVQDSSWRQIVHIDMTDPNAQCPYNLCKKYGSNNQIGCYKSGCTALELDTEESYTHVCGRVSGYRLGRTRGFTNMAIGDIDITTHYADGVLITGDNQGTHLWAYVAGASDVTSCPCADDAIPLRSPIQNNYHCELQSTNLDRRHLLWDRCDTANSCECCEGRKMHGWFYRKITQPINRIEVRWCAPEDGHIVTDILQIWVQ